MKRLGGSFFLFFAGLVLEAWTAAVVVAAIVDETVSATLWALVPGIIGVFLLSAWHSALEDAIEGTRGLDAGELAEIERTAAGREWPQR